MSLASGEVIEGSLPRRAARLVSDWVAEHSVELAACWERGQPGRAARYDRAPGVDGKVTAMDITQVEVIEGHTVRLRFEDGTEKSVDLDPYLYGPVFEEIRRDPAVFAAVRVDADAGTIVWPNGADLAPDTLYEGRRSARMDAEAQAS